MAADTSGVLETVAVVIHRDKLAAGAVLTIPYLATYVVVMIGTVVILWWDRRATSRVARPAGLPASAPSWPAQAAPAAWR